MSGPLSGEAFTFVVRHRASPQGSKDLRTNSHGGKYMAESSAGVKPFRTAVRRAALGADGRPMARFEGPVLVGIVFEFKRATSNQDDYPTGRNIGDLDKLTRAVLDALTQSGVIEDDAFVVGWLGADEPSKLWGPEDRVIITVRKAPPPRSTLVQDFTEQVGRPLEPWQRVMLDEVRRIGNAKMAELVDMPIPVPRSFIAANPFETSTAPPSVCCNSVDHKSCRMFGANGCPCPMHCSER